MSQSANYCRGYAREKSKIKTQKSKLKTTTQNSKITIIGVGNLLRKDEGIGIHVIKALQEMELSPDVSLVDGGTSPDLIAYTGAGDRMIIVDAAKAGGEPGAIYRFKPEDLDDEKRTLASAHEMGIIENLKLMELTGNEPSEVIIIGIEPEDTGWGTELSPELKKRLKTIVKIVLREIGVD
jgi:hydrogenase maturation protease